MTAYNQVHFIDVDTFQENYNPNILHQALAYKWMNAMEKKLPSSFPSEVKNESSPAFSEAANFLKKIAAETYEAEEINLASDIDIHLASLFIIKHWKYRQIFACAIGCPGRYHDVCDEEKTRPIHRQHNILVEQKLIHDAFMRQK